MNYDDFILKFPEFEGRVSEDFVNATIDNVLVETNGYQGLSSESQQVQAVALHTAFLLEAQYPANGSGNAVKRVKSFAQEVEFSVNPVDPSDFKSNQYGQRLMNFLNSQYTGGFYV